MSFPKAEVAAVEFGQLASCGSIVVTKPVALLQTLRS
jgi:hypothetical protein